MEDRVRKTLIEALSSYLIVLPLPLSNFVIVNIDL